MRILVTGGAGFIGSALVRQLIRETDDDVINIDKLTYAGNLDSLAEAAHSPRHDFERVDIVATYDRKVHSPTCAMSIPSVIALRQFVKPNEYPAFTRFNLFLRDRFRCVYCGVGSDLTFDHVVPRAQGGRTTWENVATACAPCNLRKGGRTPLQAGMRCGRSPIRAVSSAPSSARSWCSSSWSCSP